MSSTAAMVLYDVTTLHFERSDEDELRKVGVSKEHRVDPQVQVGLLVDPAGFPLDVHLFAGNKAETATLIPVLDAFAQRHGVQDMIVVAEIADGWAPLKKARFLKITDATTQLDQATIGRARQLAGLKGYVTNLPTANMDGAAVIAAYHDLWKVEQSFRMTKGDLRARPVFHHQREAIEAHLTVVFAALAVARHLQDATGTSIKKTSRPCARHAQRPSRSTTSASPSTPDLRDTARDILKRLETGHYAIGASQVWRHGVAWNDCATNLPF